MAEPNLSLSQIDQKTTAKQLPKIHLPHGMFSQLTIIAAIGFVIFGIGVIVGGYWYTIGAFNPVTFFNEVYSNFGIEMMSIGLTVIVIDTLNRRRATAERKKDLISQMGSLSNDFALDAVRQLRQIGWLTDGSLQGADLSLANLQGVDLESADLKAANLVNAKLQQAYLVGVNLQGANLGVANLHGAFLAGANLRGAELESARFDGNTTLPDLTKWSPLSDLRQFTQPEEWKASRASKGSE